MNKLIFSFCFILAISILPYFAFAKGTVVFDEEGRLLDPDEVFYMQNPSALVKESMPLISIPAVDAYDSFGFSPLHMAVMQENMANVKSLLAQKANPNIVSARGSTPLELAIQDNSLEIIKILLEAGADPNKHSPIFLVRSDKARQLLIEHGAAENPAPRDGAVEIVFDFYEQSEAFKAFVEQEKAGGKPKSLVAAVIMGKSNAELLEIIKAGADINEEHPVLHTPMEQAIIQPRRSETVKFLLAQGVNSNFKNKIGQSLLQTAIMRRNDEAMRLLLDAGADPNTKASEGEPLLLLLTDGGSENAMRYMLEAGADPNVRDKADNTPLLQALRHETSLEIVTLLLKHGANATVKNAEGKSPLAVLNWRGKNSLDIILMLLKAGAPVEDESIYKEHGEGLLHWSIQLSNDGSRLFAAALQAGANVNSLDKNDHTPLYVAMLANKPMFAQKMLKAGAFINKTAVKAGVKAANDNSEMYKDDDGLLARAVEMGDVQLVELFIEKGANIDNQSNSYYKHTPLLIAVDHGKIEIIKILLKSGANPNLSDRDKKTPLHYAADVGDNEIIKALLKAGADPELKDKDGLTAADSAQKNGASDAFIRLLSGK